MNRRSFFSRTLGALIAAVCVKAVPLEPPWCGSLEHGIEIWYDASCYRSSFSRESISAAAQDLANRIDAECLAKIYASLEQDRLDFAWFGSDQWPADARTARRYVVRRQQVFNQDRPEIPPRPFYSVV